MRASYLVYLENIFENLNWPAMPFSNGRVSFDWSHRRRKRLRNPITQNCAAGACVSSEVSPGKGQLFSKANWD